MSIFLLIRISFICVSILGMTGCIGDNFESNSFKSSKNSSTLNSNPNSATTIHPTPAPPIISPTKPTTSTTLPVNEYDLVFGKNEYNRQCATCHGSVGTGGPGGSLKMNTCSTCKNLNLLATYIAATMPSPGACIGKCSKSTAAYIFNDFKLSITSSTPTLQPINPSTPTEPTSATPVNAVYKLSDIKVLSADETLRKASIILLHRLPTVEEQDLIIAKGEAGLEDALNLLVESPEFPASIGEIYKEEIKWISPFKPYDWLIVTENLGKEWWPNYWDYIRYNNAIFNSGKALIEFTVKNNLPVSNILTADYMMVNPYSARAFNVYDRLGFSGNDDENDWRKVTLTEKWVKVDSTCESNCEKHWVPFEKVGSGDGTFGHVGLLTDVIWLETNPTSYTNLNRTRARKVYKNFLDFDVMSFGGERDISDDAPAINHPTINNPNCSICHSYIDPVASAFLQRENKSTYNPLAQLTNPDLFPVGFKKSLNSVELYGDTDEEKIENPLRWLANQLVNDPRFTMAQIHIIYRGLIGKQILRSDENVEAFTAQNQIFNNINTLFKNNNQNIKIIVKEIIKTPYFRAEGITDSNNFTAHQNTGTVRLLSSASLNKKLKSLLGSEWINFDNPYYENYFDKLSQLYGYPDISDKGKAVFASAGNISIQKKLALDMSCHLVAREFYLENTSDRLLMKKVSKTQVPMNSDGTENSAGKNAIIENIQYLNQHLFGKALVASDLEIQKTYHLWLDTWNNGNKLISQDSNNTALPCPVNRHPKTNIELSDNEKLTTDPNYVIRSWIMVMTYLLSDYRIYYE